MCVCIYIYICIHTHVYLYIHIVSVCVLPLVARYINKYVHIYIYTHVHIYRLCVGVCFYCHRWQDTCKNINTYIRTSLPPSLPPSFPSSLTPSLPPSQLSLPLLSRAQLACMRRFYLWFRAILRLEVAVISDTNMDHNIMHNPEFLYR